MPAMKSSPSAGGTLPCFQAVHMATACPRLTEAAWTLRVTPEREGSRHMLPRHLLRVWFCAEGSMVDQLGQPTPPPCTVAQPVAHFRYEAQDPSECATPHLLAVHKISLPMSFNSHHFPRCQPGHIVRLAVGILFLPPPLIWSSLSLVHPLSIRHWFPPFILFC